MFTDVSNTLADSKIESVHNPGNAANRQAALCGRLVGWPVGGLKKRRADVAHPPPRSNVGEHSLDCWTLPTMRKFDLISYNFG